ncbi:MAG TPA: alpha/beta hydrolase [Candidatus Didemnitutus sp.]|jgi:predicted esterase
MNTAPLSHPHVFEPGAPGGGAALLLLHGTGGDEHSLLAVARRFAPGAPLLGVRGMVSENGMPRFFRRFAEGIFDLEDVERRTEALADFIAAASGRYGFDLRTLTAVGYSNGANIAASLLLRRPEVLGAAALLRPMVVLEPPSVPDLSGRRVLILSGARDPIVPPNDPARLAGFLRAGNASVELSRQSGGHELGAEDFAVLQRFLAPGHAAT